MSARIPVHKVKGEMKAFWWDKAELICCKEWCIPQMTWVKIEQNCIILAKTEVKYILVINNQSDKNMSICKIKSHQN